MGSSPAKGGGGVQFRKERGAWGYIKVSKISMEADMLNTYISTCIPADVRPLCRPDGTSVGSASLSKALKTRLKR